MEEVFTYKNYACMYENEGHNYYRGYIRIPKWNEFCQLIRKKGEHMFKPISISFRGFKNEKWGNCIGICDENHANIETGLRAIVDKLEVIK